MTSEKNPRRIRVLYVDFSLGFGGAIKSLALTLRRLPDVEPLIVTSQDREIVDTWLSGYRVWSFRRVMNYRATERLRNWLGAKLRVPLAAWPLLKAIAGADMLLVAKNTLWLSWLLRRYRVDLVHLNNGFGPPEAIWAARLARVPCIVHMRGFEADRGAPKLVLMRNITHVITVSGAVAEGLQQGTNLGPERMTVVHDPVDLERVESVAGERDRVRRRHGLEPHHVAVGIFGRVIPWKGQMVFVKAAIGAMRRNADVRAVIVGDESDGGREYLEEIRATIEESGMEDRFVLTGYAVDVEAYYAAMDAVVHASIEPEPFGMVVPEGMAARRAVVAADEGGPREVITHGRDGLLVPPGDVEALAAAILRLADDPAERERLAAAGYRTAHERFGIPTNASAVRAVYDAVLDGAGPPLRARPGPAAAFVEVS